MFRRKEEGLFDTDVLEGDEGVEGVNVIPATSAPAASNPYSASGQATARPSAPATSSAPAASAPAATAPAAAQPFRPAPPAATPAAQASIDAARPRVPEAKPASVPSASPLAAKGGNRVLTVGNDILLKGEINTCDRLVIQGKVEATLNDVHTVELAESGSFKGTANVVEMQLSGSFEGELVCTGRLVIHSSGKIHGKITYGEIEIERGGQITGEIKTASASAPKAVRKEAA